MMLTVGGEQEWTVEVNHVAQLPDDESGRGGERCAEHVADHHPHAEPARSFRNLKRFGKPPHLSSLMLTMS